MSRLRSRDVPLGDDRLVRVALLGRSGRPTDLILAVGTGEGAEWREDAAEGMTLPADALSPLIDGLVSLRAVSRFTRG